MPFCLGTRIVRASQLDLEHHPDGAFACSRSFFVYVGIAWRFFFPRKKRSVVGEVALVTGAGNGIGRDLALQVSEAVEMPLPQNVHRLLQIGFYFERIYQAT